MRPLIVILVAILLAGAFAPPVQVSKADDSPNGQCPVVRIPEQSIIDSSTSIDVPSVQSGDGVDGVCTPQQSRPIAPQVQQRSVRQGILPKVRPVRGLFRRLFRR